MLYRLRIMTAIGVFTSHKTKKQVVAALAPLPVGFPQKHQGSAMTKEVPFDNIFFIVVHTTQSRPQHCASAHSPAPLSPESFYERGLGC